VDPLNVTEIGVRPVPPRPDDATVPITGVHPDVIIVGLSGVAWFLAVAWLDFSVGPEIDFILAVVIGFFVMFFTLFLLSASMIIDDPRWREPRQASSNF
jgi:hypothetical protein